MRYFRFMTMILLAATMLFTVCDGGGDNDDGGSGETTGDAVINITAIPGVAVPVRGEVPATTAIDTAQYTGTVTWSPADNPFAAETVYTATIVLTAKTGFTLTGVAADFFTVAGASSTNTAGSGTVNAVFPATGAVPDIDVVFQGAVQTGGTSGTAYSTGLTLSFDVDPVTLTADDITVTGATKGALSGSGTTRSLAISNITVPDGETVSVTITSPAGYSISGSPRTAIVYRAPDIDVVFQGAAQTGGTSGTADSTGLTLSFDLDPEALTADNITVTGATKGALSGSGTTRSLAISNITVADGETVSVTITSPVGFAISGSPQTAVVYRAPVNVAFQGAVQTGGASGTADSTSLTLSFDVDPATLTVDKITVTGATKGALSGSGTTRNLAISNITVANGDTVSVTIASPAGYSMSGSPQTAVVYRLLAIGMDYLGGKIAYILQSGDPGYDAAVSHGLIAAAADQSTGIIWALAAYQSIFVVDYGVLKTALGTGSVNTDYIIAQNGSGTGYAAGLARAYNGGGYTDWFLPSKDELNKLYMNRAAIGGFTFDDYWSSSEQLPHAVSAQYFGDGFQFYGAKDNTKKVRTVRAF